MARTNQRGLGYAHRQRVAQPPDPQGAPCPYCGQRMWHGRTPTGKTGRMVSVLDADHYPPRALRGHEHSPLRWAHRSCNRRAGTQLGNQMRAARTRTVGTTRW